MRNPERIERILTSFKTLWEKYPDLRFGQLLINLGIAEDTLLLWNWEDDECEVLFKRLAKEGLK